MMKQLILASCAALALSTSLSGCIPLIAGGVAGGAVMVGSDRRTSGAYVDDQAIELKATAQLGKKIPDAHINITSFNRMVLMTGEVPTKEERTQAETVVRALPAVNRVENFTIVAPPSSFSQRNNDTWITTKAKSRLMGGDGPYSSQAIKLVTERGVVYMLGLVTRAEGEAAANVVSQTAGVQKVVTLFEYREAVPAPSSDSQAGQPASTST